MDVAFRLSEPSAPSGCRLAEVMEISHDRVNRCLEREAYTPEELFTEVKAGLNVKGGTLSVDDSVLDKPYRQHMALVGYDGSGKPHRVVKGINLITVYYTDVHGHHQPVNDRLYDKADGKTKNDYFQDRLAEVLAWGLEPRGVTGDRWYSGVSNLKLIRDYQRGFLFALESNRRVSVEKGTGTQVQHLEIPEHGLTVWLRQFGLVKLLRTGLQDQPRHDAVYLPDPEQLAAFDRPAVTVRHDQHWQIEQSHRVLKHVCHMEHFRVRQPLAIRHHIFAALCGYVQLPQRCVTKMISHCYRLQRHLCDEVIASFIQTFTASKDLFLPQFRAAVNA
jgi:Transposase DDE domain